MKLMIKYITLTSVITFALTSVAVSQQLMGLVVQKNPQGLEEAVPGANVYWLGSTTGTATGENGIFMIDREPGKNNLIISFTGFKTDTVPVTNQTNIKVLLESEQLREVTIEGWRPTTGLDHARGINTVVMLEKELFKAACCNLSESFETNPAVDVAFTDAITGTRQIQMLGLSGLNTLITVENMPGVRGLASSQGIQLIPGTWINSIEVTKGVGPVVNGYESIAGQINVELKKPQESEKLYINGYVNNSGRSEANVNFTAMAGNKWATTFLLHGSTRPFEMDNNGDNFLDFPVGSQLNAINRWVFNSGTGWLGQFGVKVLKDDKRGGQKGFEAMDKFTTNRYGFEINTDRVELWGKLGYQFPGKPYKSFGLQLSGTKHQHDSYYYLRKVSVIAGMRLDYHNLFGTIFTPRLHARADLSETSTIRLSAGKGTRVANVLMENTGVLASSRQLVFSGFQTDKAYGFKPDQAWNYGVNFSQDFTIDYRPGTITVDYFYTDFKNQTVLDFDRSAREANFFGLTGRSYSHSFQFQTDYQLMRRFDLRMAYRWLDVKTDYLDGLLMRPLIPQHRAFMNLAYETKNKWKFDYTIQWIGRQRIPDTSANPDGYRLDPYSPEYILMNAQITKDLKDRWSVYLGVENTGNYTLPNPIVAAAEPFDEYFDSSMVWGPIFGRMAYAGFRYRIK